MNEPKSSLEAPREPPSELIREHLELILGSGVFSGAARQQRLLRHLVERHLEGRTSELKEYSLGVEVFDRGDSFDPRLDPIVRVEASRLRNRLQKYYDRPEHDTRLRIELPRGAYVPAFLEPSPDPEPGPAPEPAPEPVAEAVPIPVAPGPVTVPEEKPIARRTAVPIAFVAVAVTAIAVTFIGFATWKRESADSGGPRFDSFRRLTSESARCTSPAISPDGKTMVYARRENGHWEIAQRKLDGTDARALTSGPSDNVQPAYSPDGSKIAFRSERDGGGIFVMNAEGGNVRRLSQSGYHPSWSPDGTRIAVSTDTFYDPAENTTERSSRLAIIDVKSGELRQLPLPPNVFEGLQPVWSPDGQRIAFWGPDRNGNRQVWISPVRTPLIAVAVTDDTSINWAPTWSADGRRLFFASDRGGAMNIWSVGIDPVTGASIGKAEPLTTPSSYSGWPSLSKEGKQLAYARKLYSSKLYSVAINPAEPVDVGALRALTSGPRRVREPDMSPDGSLIIARIQDPQEDLALFRPDGTDFRRLTNDAFADRGPRWSPDGKVIVFLSNRSGRFELWSIKPDGTGLAQISNGGSVSTVWTPDGSLAQHTEHGLISVLYPPGRALPVLKLPGGFRPIAWSPDGKLVVGRSGESLVVYDSSNSQEWKVTASGIHSAVEWFGDSRRFAFSTDDGFYVADTQKHLTMSLIDNLKSKGDIHTRFTLSLDGHKIYLVLSDDEEDIWVGIR